MNEHTAALLQQLAAKLGTTSEYLWAILLKQALVFAWVTIFEYIVTTTVIVLLLRYRVTVSAGLKNFFEEAEEVGFILGLLVFIAALVWLIACIFTFSSVVTAFVNPEYWALDKVLSTVKSK